MEFSHYLVTFPIPDQPGHLLLYSTRKASLAILPEQTLVDLGLDSTQNGFVDRLVQLAMLVPDREQEKRDLGEMIAAVNEANRTLTVAVVLGLGCNFNCRYCYEGSMKRRVWMTDEIADQLIAFIQNRFRKDKKRLILDFYGGEPLLATDRIKYLARRLRPFVEEQGGTFYFTIVTNGSLLTRKIAEELTVYGLKGARITIDGPPDVHDRLRPFKNGRGSFAAIMKNIKDCCDVTKLGLGGNFTADTFKRFPELLDILEENGISPNRVARVGFTPVLQMNDQYANPEFQDGCRSSYEPWLVAASLFLREEVLRRGYRTSKIRPTYCEVEIDDTFSVNYDGTLFKCVGMIGYREYAVGNVRTGFVDHTVLYDVAGWKKEPTCQECKYLPLCFGGCRYAKLQQQGLIAGLDCKKTYLDAALGPALLQDLKYRYGMPENPISKQPG